MTAGKASGDVTVWALGAEGEKLGEIAADFEAENPDAKVKVTVIPFDAAHNKIATAIAGGQTPDVSLVGSTWVSEFAASGALDPTPTDLVDSGDFFEGAWDTTVVDGTSYGVPWYTETRQIYYRTDLAEKAGVTPAGRLDLGRPQGVRRGDAGRGRGQVGHQPAAGRTGLVADVHAVRVAAGRRARRG